MNELAPLEAKKLHTLKKWAGIISEQKNSGLNIKDFCRQNSITSSAYYYWLNQIRTHLLKINEKEGCSTFAEVTPVNQKEIHEGQSIDKISDTTSKNYLTIHLGNISLDIYGSPSREVIVSAIKAINEAVQNED